MKNPLLQINQPADVDLGRNGSLNLGIRWKADFAGRFTEGFERLQKEADGEFVRMVKPYVPKRTGALVGSTDDHTVLGSGQIVQATPYAAAQYYRLPLGQGVREDGRGPHWGERCVNDHGQEFVSFVKARAQVDLK